MVRLASRLSRDEGAVAVLVAAFAVVMFGFAAIVVDLGILRDTRAEAQSAVDSAALAGAGALYQQPSRTADYAAAVQAIKQSAADNFGVTASEWPRCRATVPSGWNRRGSGTSCILFQGSRSQPTTVQVVLPSRRVDAALGGLFGYRGSDVSALAQATALGDPVPDCGLCVLGHTDTAGDISVSGGSSFAGATGQVRSGGLISVASPGIITFESAPNPANNPSRYAPNPPRLGPVNDPNGRPPGTRGRAVAANNVICGPGGVNRLTGRLYQNITVTGPCPVTGTARIAGDLVVQGAGSLSGNSATLYFICGSRTSPQACDPGDSGGALTIAAGGDVNVSRVMYHPSNNADMSVSGTLSATSMYARDATVRVFSTGQISSFSRTAVGSLLVSAGGEVDVHTSAPLVTGPPAIALFR